MHLTERQAQIAEMVREKQFLTVEALAAHFDVATQTIRRDLNTLCDLGLARRRHGGIERMSQTGNVAYGSRQILNRKAKMAIARNVARHIPDHASLAFSIGTTPELVAEALLDHEGLKIYTNNLNIALLCCKNQSFKVSIAGGRIRPGDCDILGPSVGSFFSAYHVDFGIYGVAGVGEDGTLLDFHEEEVRARQVIRENARRTLLVLDHSKFSRHAHIRGGSIDEADQIFCEARPPQPIPDLIAASGSTLTICAQKETL